MLHLPGASIEAIRQVHGTKHKLNAKQEVQTTLGFNGETIKIGQLGKGGRWEESGTISWMMYHLEYALNFLKI